MPVSTFLFMCWPDLSHILPTLSVARGLRARGYRVVYAGLADFRQRLAREGFEYESLFESAYPLGYAEQRIASVAAASDAATRARHARDLYFATARRFAERETEELIRLVGPAVVLTDELLLGAQIVARRLGVRGVNLGTTLAGRQDASIPPITTGLLPAGAGSSRLGIFRAWRAITVPRKLDALRALARPNRPRSSAGAGAFAARLCREARLSPAQLDLDGDFAARVISPLLVLGPRELDFDRTPSPDRRYAGWSIDLDRPAEPFPWTQLDAHKKLVLCSLGTNAHFHPNATETLHHVAAVFRRRRDVELVIHAPESLRLDDIDARVVKRIPQLELLQRASLFVTHAGFGAFKEGTYFGVPMLAIPGIFDQPGNAARIAYHGVGERLDTERLPRGLEEAVTRLLEDERPRNKASSLAGTAKTDPALASTLDWLEVTCRE